MRAVRKCAKNARRATKVRQILAQKIFYRTLKKGTFCTSIFTGYPQKVCHFNSTNPRDGKYLLKISFFLEKLCGLIEACRKIDGNRFKFTYFYRKWGIFYGRKGKMTDFYAKNINICHFATKVRQNQTVLKFCDKSATNFRRQKISACDES